MLLLRGARGLAKVLDRVAFAQQRILEPLRLCTLAVPDLATHWVPVLRCGAGASGWRRAAQLGWPYAPKIDHLSAVIERVPLRALPWGGARRFMRAQLFE